MKGLSIYLVGFMGSGKSTLGRPLADALQLSFFDLDQEIESGEKTSISEIFNTRGEATFRQMEVAYLQEITAPAVVALGGGAFITEAVRTYTKNGISVFLDAPFDVLMTRIQDDDQRPLVAHGRADLEVRFQKRLPIYAQADLRVDVAHKSTDQILEKLLPKLATFS